MEHFLTDSKSAVVSSDRILYTPSSFARASLLHLQEAGTLTTLKPHKSEHTGLSSYLFITVLEGEGRVTYEGSVYQLIAGDCIFY